MTDNTGDAIILVMRPFNSFGIVIPELKRVATLSRFMTIRGTVRSERVNNEEKELRQLVLLCEDQRPSNLFAKHVNNKIFKNEEELWATKDEKVKKHLKWVADKLLIKTIRLSWTLGIPLLFAPEKKTPLHISDQLQLDDKQDVIPVMNFNKHHNGITYQLHLRIGKQLIEHLSECHLVVLTYDPGLFILNDHIYAMDENFSAKLLIPFIQKPLVEIPHRIENDYFHRFILKYVTRAEINAEGFDITDINSRPVPCLTAETSIDGSRLLSLHFKYDNMEYTPDNQTKGRVKLIEADDSFQFIRQLRNKQLEEEQMELLKMEERQTNSRGEIKFPTLSDMVSWLRKHAKKLKEKGFEVVQPSNQTYYFGPLSVEQSDTWQGDWLQTEVTVIIDNGRLRIPFREFRDTILRGEQEHMLPTGELLLIPHEWIERYADMLMIGLLKGEGFQRHRSQMPPAFLAPETQAETDSSHSHPQLLPTSIHATLRPYQLTGYQWLWQNLETQTGCCLSDEMGLGKTLQTITLLLRYKEICQEKTRSSIPTNGMLFSDEEMQGSTTIASNVSRTPFPYRTSLVLTPASVVHNWRNELSRFSPSLSVLTYTGSTDKRQEKRPTLMEWDIVLTTYRTLLNDIDYFAEQQFGIIVFDESQVFKTSTSQIHQAVTCLHSFHRIALSGTPVENNLNELWSLMNVLNPYLLGNTRNFQQTFVSPITKQMEERSKQLLRRLISPYFLKRTKEEVLQDLPERQDELVVCPMTEEQASHYAEELSRARNEWLDPKTKSQNRQMNMLATLQRLRQIANGEGKLRIVFKQLENLRQTNHKVLIFSEYVSLLNQVGKEMRDRGWKYDLLTGQTQQREQVITHFQQDSACQFFLISLKAGGVGLNLTSADYVFLLDPWWNQAAEEQAIARAHRIGQNNPVFVYRFVSANTLEEQILTLKDRKQTLIDSVMPFILHSNSTEQQPPLD